LVSLSKLRGVYANNNLLSNDTSLDQLDQLIELYLFDNNISDARISDIQAALPGVALQF
jgi:Leucine-rich repeat (LRR) protein